MAAVLHTGEAERRRCEQELLSRGLPLPLMHRLAWQSLRPATPTWMLAVHGGDGACRYAMGLQVSRSRALPAHLLLRVERLDPAPDLDGCLAGLRALDRISRRPWPRVLRVYVELYSLDPDARQRAAQCLAELRFRRSRHPRMYRHTAVVDLSGDEATVFTRLHKSARRNVRAVMKGPFEIRTVDDPSLAPRVDTLIRESFERTGGDYRGEDWSSIIRLSAREPEVSRLSGLFRQDVDGPQGLLAFEWACMHGDHAQTIAAGSARPSTARLPLAYALVWDVMKWARACGARYLDFGGITAGTHRSRDPLGGVSDFKRSFGAKVLEVGDEWTLEPHPVAATLAAGVSRLTTILRRARGR